MVLKRAKIHANSYGHFKYVGSQCSGPIFLGVVALWFTFLSSASMLLKKSSLLGSSEVADAGPV